MAGRQLDDAADEMDHDTIILDESEEDECLDMSNPQAHVKNKSIGVISLKSTKLNLKEKAALLQARAQRFSTDTSPSRSRPSGNSEHEENSLSKKRKSRYESSPESEVDEETPRLHKGQSESNPIHIDASESEDDAVVDDVENGKSNKEDSKSQSESSSKPTITLSKWASRFLVPRSHVAVIEEPDLEPMKDFILDDFGTRFRGNASEETHSVDDENSHSENEIPLVVGAPIVQKDPMDEKSNDKPKNENPKAKKAESRYFRKDLTTKCFNCGEVGHMSHDCMNTTVLRPCFMCGYRNHKSFECPHVLCHKCNRPGHEVRNCTNPRSYLTQCTNCGSSNHTEKTCKSRDNNLTNVRCMVCYERGHLQCYPIVRPTNCRIYCPRCCGAHRHEECRGNYYENNYNNRPSYENRSQDITCFVCGQPGHISAQCPVNQKYRNRQYNDQPETKRRRTDDAYSSSRGKFYTRR